MKFYLRSHGEFVLVNLPTDSSIFFKPIFNSILNKDFASILSLTFTDREISIIMTEQNFRVYFKNYGVVYENLYYSEIYNGFHVTTETDGINETGILSRLTAKFAEYQIPILNLSTYLGNYIFYPQQHTSTFEKMLAENENIVLNNTNQF